jgi:hypothetical protein
MRWTILALAALKLVWVGSACVAAGDKPQQLNVVGTWRGDYPVAQLHRLPQGQRQSRAGYIGDLTTLILVWQVFKPAEKVPQVDFGKQIVLFVRDVEFYNRTSIAKVTLKNGVVDILAMETRSALPIEDKVAMALAEIPRAGVKFIQAGKERIAVTGDTNLSAAAGHTAQLSQESAPNPLNTTYFIEGREIRLINGRSEMEVRPGSAPRIKTWVVGKPAYGDLDGDGHDDAALLVAQDAGGSGTFYYVAAALSRKGTLQGTNAVLLGDRVAPHGVWISQQVVVVNYKDRRPGEAFTSPPTVTMTKHLIILDEKLVERAPQ